MGIGWRSVQANAQWIDEVSFFAWSADPATGDLKPPNRGIDATPLIDQVVWLHARDVAALFTVTQFGSVHETLNNPAALAHLTDEIVRTARMNEFDGVDIDFEEFKPADPKDAALYTAFLDNLAKAMHAERDVNGFPKLAIATVLAKTNRGKFGYTDEEAIARSSIDRVRVMAYDDFYPGSKTPGASAPLPWTKSVASFIETLNAPAEKFILGIPGYGYQWPIKSADEPSTIAKGKSFTYPQAMTLIANNQAVSVWDAESQTHKLTYARTDPAQTWVGYYEDARSWSAKIDQVLLPSRLGGLCEWAAGFEDPASWPMIAYRLETRYPVYGAIGQCYARYGGGAALGLPTGPPKPVGGYDDALPYGRTAIEQRFEHATIRYRWGDWNAAIVGGG